MTFGPEVEPWGHATGLSFVRYHIGCNIQSREWSSFMPVGEYNKSSDIFSSSPRAEAWDLISLTLPLFSIQSLWTVSGAFVLLLSLLSPSVSFNLVSPATTFHLDIFNTIPIYSCHWFLCFLFILYVATGSVFLKHKIDYAIWNPKVFCSSLWLIE